MSELFIGTCPRRRDDAADGFLGKKNIGKKIAKNNGQKIVFLLLGTTGTYDQKKYMSI